ncbi:MAG: glycosyltransferase [Thermomicrobiales bacterium]|nr:glycosyltransferase [Thermomicrobiales bacterium]
MVRIVFLISSLQRGGAEKQLTLLVRGLDRSVFDVSVVTIYDGGDLSAEISAMGNTCLLSAAKGGRTDSAAAFSRLMRLVQNLKPDIVHGYLDTGNVLALIAGRLCGAKVAWGVRASNFESAPLDRTSRVYRAAAERLSNAADLIIANSESGRAYAISRGYPDARTIFIPNGFETARFAPDSAVRMRQRAAWGLPPDSPVIGLVARLDPVKDHPTFLRSAALLARERPDAQFVCIGGGAEEYRGRLIELSRRLGLDNRLVWAGEVSDMCAAQNALDVGTSTSTTEGFSNAVGEAMACGVPCVVTNVGDSARLVGDTGLVVPSGDEEAIKTAWKQLIELSPAERAVLGGRARARIVGQFSTQALVRETSAALLGLIRVDSAISDHP